MNLADATGPQPYYRHMPFVLFRATAIDLLSRDRCGVMRIFVASTSRLPRLASDNRFGHVVFRRFSFWHADFMLDNDVVSDHFLCPQPKCVR